MGLRKSFTQKVFRPGFSLMEMMIVLLIVAIVAAASAPMINKKMMSSASERSPWVWTGTGNNIAFNMTRNDNSTVTIGGVNPPSNINANLYIDGANKNSLAISDNSNQTYILNTNDGSLTFTTSGQYNKYNTLFGHNAIGAEEYATAFGNTVNAGNQGVAIGYNITSSGNNSIAIGNDINITDSNRIQLGATNNSDLTVFFGSEKVFESGKLIVPQSGSSNPTGGVTEARVREIATEVAFECVQAAFASLPFSDRRLKNVGKAFNSGLDEIKKLEVFNYTFKNDKSKTPRVGVMAQDLQKIFPNAVTKGEDGFLMIRMEDMFYAMVNAVKELANRDDFQAKKIQELEKQNKELKQQNKEILKRIETLEKRLNKM